jgi:Ni,Fe-hydrogenase III component G
VALTAEEIAGDLKAKLGDRLLGCEVRSPRRVYAEVRPEDLPETALYLWGERKCRFNIASGTQFRDGFEVLYHFSFNEGDERGPGDGGGVVCSVRVRTEEKENPVLPSVADRIKAFAFIERELHDLLGIEFEGHPNLVPLLRAEDWPDRFYPLRRTEERAEVDHGNTGGGGGDEGKEKNQ